MSINIEEERVAFIAKCKNQFGNAYYPMNDDWSEGEFCDPVVQRHFVTWLAAKEHATEMVKPTGRVKRSIQTGWWVYYDVYQYGGLESREAAEKWLTDRGYRVIEE